MRISSGTGLEETLANIEAATERLNTAQQTVSSGKALQAPSDNPAGVSQDLTLHAALDNLKQYQSNLNGAIGFVGTTDSALGNVVNELQSARSLAVQGADDSLTPEARAGLANLVPGILQSLNQLANTTYDSRYIFSGQRTSTAPFAAAANGTLTYQGGTQATQDGAIKVEVEQGNAVTVNVTGDQIFSQAFSVLNTLQQHLQGQNTATISNEDLTALDNVLNSVTAIQAQVGATADQLNTVSQRLDQTQVSYSSTLSQIEDADIPKAAVDLQTAQTAYQGALTVASRSFQMSLLNFLQ